MRDIKFRAWDTRYLKMVGQKGVQDFFSIRSDGVPSNEYYTLMQYTGLKDKNGKEIYERDICRDTEEYHEDNPWVAEVGYVQSGFCFVNRKCCSHCAKLEACICQIDELIADIEVIGNIYENPELLEK